MVIPLKSTQQLNGRSALSNYPVPLSKALSKRTGARNSQLLNDCGALSTVINLCLLAQRSFDYALFRGVLQFLLSFRLLSCPPGASRDPQKMRKFQKLRRFRLPSDLDKVR